jgi:hypothetical protein
MSDFNKEIKDRWHQKRKKASNWTSLGVKVFLLIALIYIVSKISTSKSIDWSMLKNKPDSALVTPN